MSDSEVSASRRKRIWRKLIPVFIPLLIVIVLMTAEYIVSNSPQFRYAPWYNTILSLAIINLNIILILVLLVVIFRNLVKLFIERKRKILGSRFRTKLVLTMIAVILVPTVLVYIIASDLISKSLDHWYAQPVEKIVQASDEVSQLYLEDIKLLLRKQAIRFSEYITRENLLSDDKVFYLPEAYLEPVMEEISFDVVEVYRGLNQFTPTIVDPESPLLPFLRDPDEEHLQWALQCEKEDEMQVSFWQENYPGGYLLRCAVPIFSPAATDTEEVGTSVGSVVLGLGIINDLTDMATAIRSEYNIYREQVDTRDEVKLNTQGLLLIFTLISLFSAIWIGTYFSKGITVPIQQLAEGTRAVAAGNLDYRVNASSYDELGILISSFNEMTKDLKESKDELEDVNRSLLTSNLELEKRSQYIETLLSNLSSAVISLDDDGRISTVNASAISLLGLPASSHVGKPWKDVFSGHDLAPLVEFIERFFDSNVVSLSEEVELQFDQQLLHLSATVTSIRHIDGTMRGSLIVLDDLTQLVRAQRTSAWREVAQRIAHEIKNPLTPIQLSAERIRRRMMDTGTGGNGEGMLEHFDLISTCTETIIEETGTLKSMVDAFSSFARMPNVQLVESDINTVLDKATAVYSDDEKGGGFSIVKKLAPRLPKVELDPDQLKMAFFNIINNAIEAMEGQGRLEVSTRFDAKRKTVVIDFTDDGPGIPPETKDKLFMPYFSTKKKGTGLGLAIVSRIISDHHGSIAISDNIPRGARFTIEFPVL